MTAALETVNGITRADFELALYEATGRMPEHQKVSSDTVEAAWRNLRRASDERPRASAGAVEADPIRAVALRLAVSYRPADHVHVIETAETFEAYLRGGRS